MFNLNDGILTSLYPDGVEAPIFYAYYLIGTLLIIAVGYLLGSINSSIIVSKLFYRDDIRRHGSGNAGTTNMLRTYGKGAALITLLGDIAKTGVDIISIGGLTHSSRSLDFSLKIRK